MPVEPWISLAEVAKHLDIHVETVRRWVLSDSMPATKIGKVWRFKVSEVDAWARASAAKIASPARHVASTKAKGSPSKKRTP
jgi:excisionase family DNA binding protein